MALMFPKNDKVDDILKEEDGKLDWLDEALICTDDD